MTAFAVNVPRLPSRDGNPKRVGIPWPDCQDMKLVSLILTFLLLAGCATTAPEPDSLDAVARDYVRMQLEIGERDEGYVDAYYGPPAWRQAAHAAPRTVEQLAAAAEALQARVAALPVPADP